MRWRALLVVLVVLPLAACLDMDLTLKPDGAVAGTISWTSTSKLPEQGARALLAHKDVTIKKLELKDVDVPSPGIFGTKTTPGQRVTAEVEAPNAAALVAIPLLKSLGASAVVATPEADKRTLTVRAARNEALGSIPDTESVVRLHLPGPVTQTTAEASGNDVTWKVPAADFKKKPSVEMSVSYTVPNPPAATPPANP
ncbi:MAG TPA: hypothetical protein VNO26_05060 [Candidatus Limnocylindria bacterium]|nr:hypothetical protein [Candidatus Limnocylindria bacterium]